MQSREQSQQRRTQPYAWPSLVRDGATSFRDGQILTGGGEVTPTAPQSAGESLHDRGDSNRRQHATARGISWPGAADRERREPVRVYAAVRRPRVPPPGIQGPWFQRAWF